MSTKTPGAAQLKALISQARAAIATLPAGRQRDNRTARLDIEAARLFPTKDKRK